MKKTMKTFEANNLYDVFLSLSSDKERKIPGNIAWNILRVFRQLEVVRNDFNEFYENKFKSFYEENKAVETTDENRQNIIRIKEEYMPEFITYMNEVASTEVDIEFYTISQESFDRLLNTCDLTIPEIQAIEKMVNVEN